MCVVLVIALLVAGFVAKAHRVLPGWAAGEDDLARHYVALEGKPRFLAFRDEWRGYDAARPYDR